ncbi:MAG: ribonuclease [Clostridiales bacterium]|nr:ribonuclease [Clostridiales bacterium]MDD7486392.1 ribonuclease domain-containing protein [Clostridiales bacterium]MDY2690373.1 ribonuclease domain-containing protein [Oscillospiraceae bacterium]
MTRRIAALLLALLLALSLTACGNPAQTMDTIEKAAQTVQQIAEVLNDTEEDTESAALPASEAQEAAEEASEEPAQASDQETAAEEPAEAAAETPAIDEDGVYTTKDDVALYLHTYGHLPSNFITKKEAEKLGWSGGSLEPYAPGKCIGGSHFGNYEGILPEKDGRSYTECDIDTLGADKRGAKRIVFSNDGLIYYTEDHYETFELLYGEES